jgi:hypothetical protein
MKVVVINWCFLIYIVLTFSFCSNFNNKQKVSEKRTNYLSYDTVVNINIKEYYPDTVLWKNFYGIFNDTVIFFRNYIVKDNSIRIAYNQDCNCEQYGSLIFEKGNIENIIKISNILKRMNKFQFIYCEKNSNNDVIVHLCITDNLSLKTFENTRYLIRKNKIILINLFPSISDSLFIPYDEFTIFDSKKQDYLNLQW